MRITQRVKKILSHYESDNAGSKGSLARILMGIGWLVGRESRRPWTVLQVLAAAFIVAALAVRFSHR